MCMAVARLFTAPGIDHRMRYSNQCMVHNRLELQPECHCLRTGLAPGEFFAAGGTTPPKQHVS